MYALLVLVTAPPMIPNSALLAGAGALAASGCLSLPLLVITLLASTITGDMALFWAGRRTTGRARAWLERSARRRSMLARTASGFRRWGVASVVAVRFVPTGRGVVGLTAGVVRFPGRSFLLGAAIAEAVFVTVTVGLGYVSGRLPLGGSAPFVIGPAVSTLTAAGALVFRRISHRRVNRTFK
jgi:membrane protein DedA with SNARE-associated domain